MKFNYICWNCHKEYEPETLKNPPTGEGINCECGGCVVSPSGKVQLKKVE